MGRCLKSNKNYNAKNRAKYPQIIYSRSSCLAKQLEETKVPSFQVQACPNQTTQLFHKHPSISFTKEFYYSTPQAILNLNKTQPMIQKDSNLVFSSLFESGNLDYAVKVTDFHYLLILQYDSKSTGHTQWYYFSISNTKQDADIQFSIINMVEIFII